MTLDPYIDEFFDSLGESYDKIIGSCSEIEIKERLYGEISQNLLQLEDEDNVDIDVMIYLRDKQDSSSIEEFKEYLYQKMLEGHDSWEYETKSQSPCPICHKPITPRETKYYRSVGYCDVCCEVAKDKWKRERPICVGCHKKIDTYDVRTYNGQKQPCCFDCYGTQHVIFPFSKSRVCVKCQARINTPCHRNPQGQLQLICSICGGTQDFP
mgnify:CR=1 FL=1